MTILPVPDMGTSRSTAAVPAPAQPPASVPVVDVLLVAGTRTRLTQLERMFVGSTVVVAGSARNADEAELLIESVRPSAVLMDLDFDAGGLDVVERIMSARPTPIVVCGAAAERPEAALAAGAVDVIGALDAPPGSPEYTKALERHLKVASRVRVISHPRARLRHRNMAPSVEQLGRLPVVAIGASTGGPPALAHVIGELPRGFEAAVVVVQHMADGFVEGLARWLDETCRLPVVVAADGERLRAGVVHVAPANANLTVVAGSRLRVSEADPAQFHSPCIDVTFRSVAQIVGQSSVGVLLTGMGRDGAEGLRAMRSAGAFTIGQDEATSVVWGMPGAAAELDAVSLELPLQSIGASVVDAVRRARTRGVMTP